MLNEKHARIYMWMYRYIHLYKYNICMYVIKIFDIFSSAQKINDSLIINTRNKKNVWEDLNYYYFYKQFVSFIANSYIYYIQGIHRFHVRLSEFAINGILAPS